MVKISVTSFLLMATLAMNISCKRKESFKTLGTKVASPIDIAASDDGEYFYVLNNDLDRSYNKGSILVLDKDGNKIRAVETPRLGRSMAVAGNDMLLTFQGQMKESSSVVQLYDLSDPTNPQLTAYWNTSTCTPINSVIRKNYKYFAVSCYNGEIMIGTLENERRYSSLQMVRSYNFARHALHIDPERGVLFAFPTDMWRQNLQDVQKQDVETYDPDKYYITADEANEIPDEYESSKSKDRLMRTARQKYQFVLYDIEEEAKVGFPERHPVDGNPTKDKYYKKELRWLYFNLANFDGYPDSDIGFVDLSQKIYRTNFWAAVPDSYDNDIFYLSQRGRYRDFNPNNIIRVKITGDIVARNSDVVPHTENVVEFERVFGFKGESKDSDFPGDFKIFQQGSYQLLVLNSFKDLASWKKDEVSYSIGAKVLDENFWYSDLYSTNAKSSYYQVAVNKSGRVATCSFYGNAVIFLDIDPTTGITIVNRVE